MPDPTVLIPQTQTHLRHLQPFPNRQKRRSHDTCPAPDNVKPPKSRNGPWARVLANQNRPPLAHVSTPQHFSVILAPAIDHQEINGRQPSHHLLRLSHNHIRRRYNPSLAHSVEVLQPRPFVRYHAHVLSARVDAGDGEADARGHVSSGGPGLYDHLGLGPCGHGGKELCDVGFFEAACEGGEMGWFYTFDGFDVSFGSGIGAPNRLHVALWFCTVLVLFLVSVSGARSG
eukprot:TRINITY_DN104821_c0_g1_i1.p2 TRINITY_DN104821_c0_g1~~TRINITY_DN104821_c0_g1_i1.p2  ORF type:complete len:230 (-),score=-0.42 TRINITY_DN104821_c0_g1_i1:255-944(-)